MYLSTALGRIFFSSVVILLAFSPGVLGSNPARSLYFFYVFVCYKLSSYDGDLSRIVQWAINPICCPKMDFLLNEALIQQ